MKKFIMSLIFVFVLFIVSFKDGHREKYVGYDWAIKENYLIIIDKNKEIKFWEPISKIKSIKIIYDETKLYYDEPEFPEKSPRLD